MKVFKIEHCIKDNVIVVSANSPEDAIEKANIQDAYMYHIAEVKNMIRR